MIFVYDYRLTEKDGLIFDGYGNYSEDNKCTWLIAPENNTRPIYLQFKQFSTECGWDHLYIYDGDSTFSPLLVAYRYVVCNLLVKLLFLIKEL